MGTSDGLTETSVWYKAQEGMLLPSKTFGEQLLELGHSYKMYYQDSPWELFIRGILHRPQDLAAWDQFHADSKNGALPDWSFIWPRMGIDTLTGAGSNDQHPDHDVALGEALMKEVYEALRNGPQWEDTLLLITYDEHGGKSLFFMLRLFFLLLFLPQGSGTSVLRRKRASPLPRRT